MRIGSLVLRHPSLKAADGPALGEMIEDRVQHLLQSDAPLHIGSAGVVRLNLRAPRDVHSREATARSIAEALHRGLSRG